MQTELTNAQQNAKLKIKYTNRNLKMIFKTKKNKIICLKVKMDKMMLT